MILGLLRWSFTRGPWTDLGPVRVLYRSVLTDIGGLSWFVPPELARAPSEELHNTFYLDLGPQAALVSVELSRAPWAGIESVQLVWVPLACLGLLC